MKKDLSYYESAIKYNAAIAEFAEQVAPTLPNEEVRRWCSSLAKKHRIHEKRHRIALDTVRARQEAPVVKEDNMDTASTVSGLEMVASASTEVKNNTLAEGDTIVLADGCSPFHDPSTPNCEFFPSISQGPDNG